jgi:hypothetical protein
VTAPVQSPATAAAAQNCAARLLLSFGQFHLPLCPDPLDLRLHFVQVGDRVGVTGVELQDLSQSRGDRGQVTLFPGGPHCSLQVNQRELPVRFFVN